MQERRFLFITSFLVALVGAPAVYSVVREPTVAVAQNSTVTGKEGARKPASVSQPIVVSSKNGIRSRSVVMDYDCKKPQFQEVEGTLLRLKGNDAGCMNENWKDIKIVNRTNGFTASVIFVKDGFTTDFIDLREGDNDLEISALGEQGQAISQRVLVKRRFPAGL